MVAAIEMTTATAATFVRRYRGPPRFIPVVSIVPDPPSTYLPRVVLTAHRRRTMKAAVYYETGGPEVFRYEDVPDPTCGPGEVLVRVQAISIEGGDTLNRLGGDLPRAPHRRLPVRGRRCSRWVTAWTTSRRATGWSPSGSTVRTPNSGSPDGRSAGRFPTGCPSRRRRACPCPSAPPTTASSSSVGSQAGETVLIHAGAGGVGIAAIQMAKRAGAHGAGHGVGRRPARTARTSSVSTTASTTPPPTSWSRCAS